MVVQAQSLILCALTSSTSIISQVVVSIFCWPNLNRFQRFLFLSFLRTADPHPSHLDVVEISQTQNMCDATLVGGAPLSSPFNNNVLNVAGPAEAG